MGRPARSTAETPASNPSDADAIARVRAGDHEAFRVLVERYQGRAHRLALRVLRDEDLARDAVQDSFLKAYSALDRFEGRSSFYTWLYRLVMNRCLDMKRSDRSSRHVEWDEERAVEATEGAGSAAEVGQGTPEAQLERSELRALVARAIEELPEDARRIIALREIDGLNYAEIAEILGVPKGTVMSRLHYARRRIRAALEATGAMDWVEG